MHKLRCSLLTKRNWPRAAASNDQRPRPFVLTSNLTWSHPRRSESGTLHGPRGPRLLSGNFDFLSPRAFLPPRVTWGKHDPFQHLQKLLPPRVRCPYGDFEDWIALSGRLEPLEHVLAAPFTFECPTHGVQSEFPLDGTEKKPKHAAVSKPVAERRAPSRQKAVAAQRTQTLSLFRCLSMAGAPRSDLSRETPLL